MARAVWPEISHFIFCNLLIYIRIKSIYGAMSVSKNFPNKLSTLTHIHYLKNRLVVLVIYYFHRFFNCYYRDGYPYKY
ncbi:hypothetical protein F0T03_04335 [Yersinia canariae]|uniref:Uncharacterized protein n=1 Tax=Yersinia canariae TaxID=2607663 RepID=A0A857EXC8_9GAMM|nr:hypothetical protein F0T03_04335 [Yersinia canariae]